MRTHEHAWLNVYPDGIILRLHVLPHLIRGGPGQQTQGTRARKHSANINESSRTPYVCVRVIVRSLFVHLIDEWSCRGFMGTTAYLSQEHITLI